MRDSQRNTQSGGVNRTDLRSRGALHSGGTTSTAIAALAIAKLAENKLPSLLKWVLYLTGGTMIAGSGANITQTIMKALGL